jgi:glycogen synthase
MVTRLTDHKVVDLVLRALPEIIAGGGQLVVLGD